MTTFKDYQEAAVQTAVYPELIGLMYVTIGLAGETGEVAEKIKKLYRDRDGVLDDEYRSLIVKEIGDVLWYLATLCTELGVNFEDAANANIDKLRKRMVEGTIKGNGDTR